MKALDIFYFLLIFPFVMWMFSLIGVSSYIGGYQEPSAYVGSFVVNFTASSLLSLAATFGISIFINVDPIKLFVYTSFNLVVVGMFFSFLSNFDPIAAQSPVWAGFMIIIKVIIGVVVLITSYQLLFGSGWEGYK